jgi:hypothetical protein
MASIIDRTLAKSLIKEYQNQNAAQGGPCLVTPTEDFLSGYYIDRQSLEAILKNPAFTGLSVYLAKHPNYVGSKENCFTIVFAGAQPNVNFTAGGDVPPYTNPDDLYEYLDNCPPACGDVFP